MFINPLSPYLLDLGFFQIRWYSIMYMIGFAATWWYLNKHRDDLGVNKKTVEEFIFYAVIGVIVGARLFEVVVWDPTYYWSHPQYILAVWRGGLSFHGGFVGLLVAGWLWCRRFDVKFWQLADLVTLPAVFGLAMGRIGNFFNHELYGPITNVPWCVQFKTAEGCRHPAQLYGAIGRFFTLGILVYISKFRQQFRHGFITWCFIFLIGAGRFVADFWRVDDRFLLLSTGQWLSAVMVIVAAVVIFMHYVADFKLLLKNSYYETL